MRRDAKMREEDRFSVGRRRFFNQAAAAALGTLVLPEALAAHGVAAAAEQQKAQIYKSGYTKADSSSLSLGNERIEFSIDLRSGAMKEIVHKSLRRMLQIPKSAAAPGRIWLGSAEQPDQTEALISQASPQKISHRLFNYPGGIGVEIDWPNLKDKKGQETGIAVHQVCTLENDSQYLRLRNRVVNRGDSLITGLFLGLQGLKPTGDAAAETLTAPTGGMGQKWANPRVSLAQEPKVFSIPPTAPGGLVCGWLDLSSAAGGFGIGYLNRRGMDMLGEARFEDMEASLGWRMFRYQGGWAFMEKINGPSQIYPLRPGEEFSSDDWFVGLHASDWHETAEFYRKEYERVFDGDFLTWEKTSTAARHADLIINTTAAWGVMTPDKKKHDLTKGEVRNRFLDIPGKVKRMIDELGITPANSLVVILGQATHWGIYKLPDYFPVNKEAGAQEAFNQMIRQLRQDIGVAGTHFYAHATFNHPQADNYVAEADTGWDANLYTNYDHLGRIACMDSKAWWELWQNKIIPGFVDAGASGIEFDEGFGHHFICSKATHIHGLSAESILTAQSRGALRIFRQCRRAFGPNGYLESEGGSDVGARHFDLWETGGKSPFEVVRYTHPDKLITLFANNPEDFNRAFIYGMVVLHSVGTLKPEVLVALRSYVELRRQLRQQKAPGYPYGFRDDRGLTIETLKIRAKAFSDARGITVAYYATEAVSAKLTVKGQALGHPKLGVRQHSLKLAEQQAGYFILAYPNHLAAS